MKAISIHPEPAMEILSGKKTEEDRAWSTHYRGPLLVCSTAIKTPGYLSAHAVCIVDLVEVKKMAKNSYRWIFANVRWIKPFPFKGQRRIYQVPDDQIIELADEENTTEEFWQEHYLALLN